MKIWEQIKCKGCSTQEKRLFQLQPSQTTDDCWCEDCKVPEMERRAKL